MRRGVWTCSKGVCVIGEWPSCPESALPQEWSSPVAVTMSVWDAPAATCATRTPAKAATSFGASWLSKSPWPSCPCLLYAVGAGAQGEVG